MKTCKHGHKLTTANLYVNRKTGARACRTCNRESALAAYYRRKHGVEVIPYRYKTKPDSSIPFKKVHGTLRGEERGLGLSEFRKSKSGVVHRRVRTNKYSIADFVTRGI